MNYIQKISIVILIISGFCSNAQETGQNKMIEAIIEAQLENLDEETDASIIIEELEDLAENPININATNATELSRLYILNEIQIAKLLDYIQQFGPVYSIFELNTIDGFTPGLLHTMGPFIKFGEVKIKPETVRDALKYPRQQVLFRTLTTTQKAKGYKEKEDGTIPFEGNAFRYYTRYKFEAGDRIVAGFTAEKDPGEAFLTGSNKRGFDYYSGHVRVNINSFIQHITVGDFIVQSGQGLVLWQGYTNGKSVYSMDISKSCQGVRAYTSADENLFFRGTATALDFKNTRLSLFYSQKKRDANLESSAASPLYFTSLQSSGYHRTASETEDENSVKHSNWGAIVNSTFMNLQVGATFLYDRFNVPFYPTDQLYNRFRFSGKENMVAGINYLYNKGKYQLFGEAAMSKSKGKAFLQGAIARLNDRLNFSLLYRHYDKNYQTLWGNAFSEGSSVSNESGIYFGSRILPVKFVTFSAYSDFYRSDWINFTTAGPSSGWDIFAQANVVFSEKFEFYLRYKNEEKEQKFTVNERYENLPETIKKARFHIQYKPVEFLTFKTRAEHAGYSGQEKENGWMVFQDVQFEATKIPVNISARIAWFSTDSYNSRIYAYENDLLYTFSIPAYYGKGFRQYINIKWKISDQTELWIKVANTRWNDRNTISSGYNEIEGRNKTELKFQLRLKI